MALPFVGRIVALHVRPKATFLEIDREKAGLIELYRDYAVWLAAVGPVAAYAKGLIATRGNGALAALLPVLALPVLFSLIGVYLLAVIASLVAPLFGGERDEDSAIRLVVFALTPAWISAAFLVSPTLAPFSVLGLWSLVLIWRGAPQLLRCPAGGALPITTVLALAMAALASGLATLAPRAPAGWP